MIPAPASESGPVVEIRNLDFSFPGHPVLDGVSLELGRGEIFGLLGPNGAGKTTLVRALCGRLKPGAGEVRVMGLEPGDRRVRTAIGLVPQQVAVYGHLTPAENLAAFARLSGMARAGIGDGVRFSLEACGLEDHRNIRVSRLSGGYQRRVNLAAAIVHRPGLLVLDEPTVGVDPQARRGIENTLVRLAGTGMTILMTSHDLDQVQALADRVGFLNGGRLVAAGTPGELIRRHFGDSRELLVELEAPLPEAADSPLRAAGLAPDPEHPTQWVGRIESRPGLAEDTVAELENAGLRIREFTIRKPDLSSLYRVLNRRPGGPA